MNNCKHIWNVPKKKNDWKGYCIKCTMQLRDFEQKKNGRVKPSEIEDNILKSAFESAMKEENLEK